MADLSLTLEIDAQFDKLRDELFGVRNSVKQTADQVKAELNESLKQTSASGEQLRTTVQQLALGLRQMVRGDVAAGVKTLSQSFVRLKDDLLGVKTTTTEVGTELTAASAAATSFGSRMAALGPIGIAVGIAIVAALAAVALSLGVVSSAIDKLLELAKRVGTQSQEDFLKMKRAIEDVGGRLTFIDQLLSQNILRASADVKSAFDLMWLNVLRESGPSLIRLLKEVSGLVASLGPVAANVGEVITFHIKGITNAIRFARIAFLEFKVLAASGNFMTPEVRAGLLKPPKKPLLGGFLDPNEDFVLTDPLGTDPEARSKAAKKAAEDMAAIELAMNRLNRTAEDTRVAFTASLKAIEENFEAGGISAEEFFQQIVAEETRFVQQQVALIAQERKLIQERPTLPRQKINELEELAAREAQILNASNARIIEADRKAIEALQKAHDKRDKLIDREVEALEKSKKQWSDYAEHVTQQLIKIHNQEVDNEAARERIRLAQEAAADAEIRRQGQELDPTSNINVFGIDPLGELTKLEALKEGARGALGDLNQVVGNFGGLMRNSLLGVAAAAQQVLATFILTGKLGGAAFKQLAANILAELVVMSAVKAIYNLAEGLFALTNPFTAWKAPLHFAAAKFYGIVAGVAGAAAVGIGAAGGLGGGGGGSVGSEFAADTRRPAETRVQQRDGFQFIPGEGNAFQQMVDLHRRQTDTLERLDQKIEGTSSGDVLMRGINEQPRAIPTGVRQALRSDQGFVRDVALATQRG